MKFFENKKEPTSEKIIVKSADLLKTLEAAKVWIERRNDIISSNVQDKYYYFYQSTFLNIAEDLFATYFTTVLKHENLTSETIGIKVTLCNETLQTLLTHIEHMNAEVAHLRKLLNTKVKLIEGAQPKNLYSLILDDMEDPEKSTNIDNLLNMIEEEGEVILAANDIFKEIINFLGKFASYLENAKNNKRMLEILDAYYLYRPCMQIAESSAIYLQTINSLIKQYEPFKNRYIEAKNLIEFQLDDFKFLKFIMRIKNEIEGPISYYNTNLENFLARLTEIKKELTFALNNALTAKNNFDKNNIAVTFKHTIQQLETLIPTWAKVPQAEFFCWYLSLIKQDTELSLRKIDKVDGIINSLDETLQQAELVSKKLESNEEPISSANFPTFSPKRKRGDDEIDDEDENNNYKYSKKN